MNDRRESAGSRSPTEQASGANRSKKRLSRLDIEAPINSPLVDDVRLDRPLVHSGSKHGKKGPH